MIPVDAENSSPIICIFPLNYVSLQIIHRWKRRMCGTQVRKETRGIDDPDENQIKIQNNGDNNKNDLNL